MILCHSCFRFYAVIIFTCEKYCDLSRNPLPKEMENIGEVDKHVCMLSETPQCIEVPPTAGCKRWLLCAFRWAVIPHACHSGAAQYLRSARHLAAECARARPRAHPYSPLVSCWHLLHMLLTQAVLLYMPFQVFRICPNRYDPFILVCDLMSALNICLTFLTGYVDEQNQMIIMDGRVITRHYLKTTFFPDLVACLPLQLIAPFPDCQYPTHTVMFLFKLLRLLTLSKEWAFALDQMRLSYIKQQTAKVVHNVILFFHWMAFIHYQVPMFTIQHDPEERRGEIFNKYVQFLNVEHRNVFHKYTAHLFLVARLCIGAGSLNLVKEHIVADMLVSSGMGLIGLVFMAYSFSILLRLVMYAQYNGNVYYGRLTELNKYMTFKRLPKFLQRKVHLFFNYKFNGQLYNENSILNTINEQIKQDINMFSCKQLILNIPMFQDMPVALINAIIFSLTQVLYMPGEVLVRSNSPGTSLYIISSGTVAVLTSSGREITHLRDGAYFGETALLRPETPRFSTIIAVEITETYRLDSSVFQSRLQPYPHMRRRLEESYLRRRASPKNKSTYNLRT